MSDQTDLFSTVPGHDGLPPRVEPAAPPRERPRDRATVQANHQRNARRAGGRFDEAILGFLTEMIEHAPETGVDAGWSPWFLFETDRNRPRVPCCADRVGYVVGTHPRPDTCRRRGAVLADREGIALQNVNGAGLYRARLK